MDAYGVASASSPTEAQAQATGESDEARVLSTALLVKAWSDAWNAKPMSTPRSSSPPRSTRSSGVQPEVAEDERHGAVAGITCVELRTVVP